MAEDQHPLGIADVGRLAAVGIGELGGLLNVRDQVFPGGGEALVGLRLGTALHQSLNHARSRNFLAAAIEDLLLKLSDQGIRLIAQLDRELRHAGNDVYLRSSTAISKVTTNPLSRSSKRR